MLNLKSSLNKIYYLFLLTIVLPGGKLYGFPVKDIIFYLLLFVLLFYLSKNNLFIDKNVTLLLIVMLFVITWCVIGTFNDYFPYSLSQTKNFFSLYLTIVITYVFINNNLLDLNKIKKVLYLVMFVKIISKLIVEFLVMSGILSIVNFNYLYNEVFNWNPVIMYIDALNLIRIQTASDIFPVVIFGFYFLEKDVKVYKKSLVLALTSIYVIIIYSRVILVQFIVMLIILFFYMFRNLLKRDIKRILVFPLLGALLLYPLSKVNLNDLTLAIIDRFNSYQVSVSDDIRENQSRYLVEKFGENIFLGNGIGAYSKDYIRSLEAKYSYEKEYLSFLMQLGLLGFLLIIVFSIYIFYRMLSIRRIKSLDIKIIFIFNFVFWAIKPFFNPSFLSSNSGIIISILIIFSSIYLGDLCESG
jgi:O-antigen ligase